MRVENSPKYERKIKQDAARREAERKQHKAAVLKAFKKARAVGGWQPITTCPFEALDSEMKEFLVADEKHVAVVRADKRFGTPVEYEVPPEMVMRDGQRYWEGGKVKKTKRPPWWYKWELKNMLDYDARYGRDEIEFVPSHWMPFPEPPHASHPVP